MERSAQSEVLGLAKRLDPTYALPGQQELRHPRLALSDHADRCGRAAHDQAGADRAGDRARRGRRLHAARRRQLLCSRARAGQSCPQPVRIVRHRIAVSGHGDLRELPDRQPEGPCEFWAGCTTNISERRFPDASPRTVTTCPLLKCQTESSFGLRLRGSDSCYW